MKCPRCNQEDWNPATSCPNCGFSGPAGPAEELAHIRYLLAELERWTEIPRTVREHLQARYTRRARELEIALGLRPPPPTPEEAQELARALARLVATRDFLLRWGPLAWRKPETALQRIGELEREIALRRARLAETETAPSLPPSLSPQASLETLRVVRDEVIPLIESGTWTDEAGARKALAELDQSIARLEIRLGLRPPPVRKEKPIPPAVPTVPSAPARPPRQPLTWDLFWRALLSERTLRTLLFVGAFLVFASAVTLVVYNWERFTPWGQVAILSTFTLFFYGLGGYVRGTMKLRNSGIALTATASLLVPVDFYAVYLSGGIFPKEAWAEVWWLTSALLPIWGLYLLARFYPSLPHAHFGLLLLLFGPLLFTLARLLRLVHPADALPFYLSGYASAIAGTAVVSYDRPLLALALLWDTGLALASLLVLREPAWGYPAAACPAGALLLALAERNFPPDWRGLWLVGLAAVYLLIAWALRRQPAGSSPRLARQYATSPMVVAYTLLGLGLPIAGQEKLAAAWTFGTAVVLYGLSAFWLREPLFLFPAMGLAPVPYIVALEQTGRIAPEDWGLALWPGILVVWALGWVLERRFGDWPPFPWNAPIRWLSEAARRLVGWWPLAPYLLATLGTVTAVSWSWDDPPRRALALLLAAIAYGWALGHFRRRGWLIALLTAAQGAWWSVVDGMALERLFGPQERPAESAWRAFAFLPATLLTALVGLAVQRQWGEGPPLRQPAPGMAGLVPSFLLVPRPGHHCRPDRRYL